MNTPNLQITLHQLLRAVVDKGASDLHVTTGTPPQLRIDGSLIPLVDLLLMQPEAFVAHHANDAAGANRAYLSCWALGYYLTFEKRLFGTPAFRAYLVEVNSGLDPRAAFERLIGQDLPTFEWHWHDYLLRLQSDLVELVEAAIDGKLDTIQAQWDPRPSLGVVMAAAGYPGTPRTGDIVNSFDAPDLEAEAVAAHVDDGEHRRRGGGLAAEHGGAKPSRTPRASCYAHRLPWRSTTSSAS